MIEAVTETESIYLREFARLEQESESRPAWLQKMRKEAIRYFQEAGFPGPREEAWRHTNIKPLTKSSFSLARTDGDPGDLEAGYFRQVADSRLVFVNGRFDAARSTRPDIAGVRVRLFSEAWDAEALKQHLGRYAPATDQPFQALNMALFSDGVLIEVEAGAAIEEPLQVLYMSVPGEEPLMSHPRVLIVAGENSQISIVETHLAEGEGAYFTNSVTEVAAANGTVVDHYKLQHESREAFHFGSFESSQGRSSSVQNSTITLGGKIVRNQTGAVLDGEGGWAGLNGLFLVSGDGLVDNFTRLHHAQPHCDSREVYRGILEDRGRGVFRGRIIVDKGAQKTDSKQTNKNLLLSDEALINTKPQLEIYADDVKCTHGATIGQLDADAVFYLRSRGIDRKAAESVLIYAFANELVDDIKVPALREQLDDYLFEWLPRGDLVREAV